jgi:two-component system nitrogen regulation sensor histidine kinase GlnL
MNPAAESLTGHSLCQHKNKKLDHLIYATQLHNHILRAIQDSQSHVTREGRIHLSNGRQITIECAVTPLYEQGEIIGSLLEINQVDRQLRIVRDAQILTQQETSQTVLQGIAHEVKNPLGGIRGAAQLLEDEFENEELKEYTQIIISEADRLKNLIDRMLGSSKLPKMCLVNIHEVMEHVRQLLLNCKPANIRILSNYDPSLPEFIGDRDQLVQVVLNIANNAVNALGDQQGEITLRTRVKRYITINDTLHPLVLCASIIDNGAGIPKALQDKIFFPMISGNPKGAGLGLSIAQSLVNRHGGLVEYARKNQTTEFNIYIPLGQNSKNSG